jgi:hypothetical protein
VNWKFLSEPATEPFLIDLNSLSLATNFVRMVIVSLYNSLIVSLSWAISLFFLSYIA